MKRNLIIMNQPTQLQRSAYIHIPFCEHICFYCDFNKVFLEGQPVDEYVTRLLDEISLTLAKQPITASPTIYIGGGTPTSLNEAQLDALLSGVVSRFPMETVKEFTIEANPGDLTKGKLQVMKNYGIDRLSMGVQTFDDRLLKKIGRKHSAQDVYDTLALLDKEGFHNISIDLIYALPGQTLEGFSDTLAQALAFDLPHYSLYSLILENKTMFMNWVRQGRMELPSQEVEVAMFEQTIEAMEKSGYHQYEISNFAKPGFESKHNLVYWNNEEYFGFGAGASGYVDQTRYRNFGPIQHYLNPLREQTLPIMEQEPIARVNQIEEELFLGLRKQTGVSKAHFETKFSTTIDALYRPVLDELIAKGWLIETKEAIALTKAGMFVGNEVFERFLLDK